MKKLIFFIVTILVILPCAAMAQSTPVPILLYHNVTDAYNNEDTLVNVSPGRFEEHISTIISEGYNIISFQQYIKYCHGEAELPENPVIITFDDGYSSVYYKAYPILMKYNAPATVFIISGLVGFNDTLYPHFTWEQAAEMDKSGYIDIQSHSNFHYDATKISLPRLILELRKSKYDIETRLNKQCNILAFPYGEYNAQGLNAAVNAGFEAVARTHDRGTNRKENGLFYLNRLFVRGNQSGEDVVNMLKENNNLKE